MPLTRMPGCSYVFDSCGSFILLTRFHRHSTLSSKDRDIADQVISVQYKKEMLQSYITYTYQTANALRYRGDSSFESKIFRNEGTGIWHQRLGCNENKKKTTCESSVTQHLGPRSQIHSRHSEKGHWIHLFLHLHYQTRKKSRKVSSRLSTHLIQKTVGVVRKATQWWNTYKKSSNSPKKEGKNPVSRVSWQREGKWIQEKL